MTIMYMIKKYNPTMISELMVWSDWPHNHNKKMSSYTWEEGEYIPYKDKGFTLRGDC